MRKTGSGTKAEVQPLAIYRILAGKTQAELARSVAPAGIRRATVSEIENGKRRPRRSTALGLAQALEVAPEYLFPDLNLADSRRASSHQGGAT